MTIPKARPGAVMAACVEWEPDVPPHLSAAEWHQYRTGRDSAFAEMAAELGINAAVVEL